MERERELALVRANREAAKLRREEEKERDKKMRHMLKVSSSCLLTSGVYVRPT